MDLDEIFDSAHGGGASGGGDELDAIFDAAHSSGSIAPSVSNPKSDEGFSIWDFAGQVGSGLVEGTAETLDFVDQFNPMALGGPKLFGFNPLRTNQPGLTETIKPLMAEEDPNYRYTREVSRFLSPGVVAKATSGLKAVQKAPDIAKLLGWLGNNKAMTGDALAGVGFQAGEDIAPNSTVVPLIGALAAGSAPGIVDAGYRGVKSLLSGVPEESIDRAAGSVLRRVSDNTPEQLQDVVARETARNPLGDGWTDFRTSAEITGDTGIARLQEEIATSADTKGRFARAQVARAGQREAMLDSLSDVKAVPDDFPVALRETAENTQKSMLADAEELWNDFPREAEIRTYDKAQELENLLNRQQAGLPNRSAVRELSEQITRRKAFEDAKARILKDDPDISPEDLNLAAAYDARVGAHTSGELQDIRSDALAELRDNKSLKPREREILTKIANDISNENNTGLLDRQLLGTDAANYEAARKATRLERETFGRSTVGGSLVDPKTLDENITKKAFPGSKKGAQNLKKVIDDDPQTLEEVKRAILDEIPRDSKAPIKTVSGEVIGEGGQLTPASFKRWLDKKKTGFIEIFGEKHYDRARKVLEDMQSEASVSSLALQGSGQGSRTQPKLTIGGAISEILDNAVPTPGWFQKFTRYIAGNNAEAAEVLLKQKLLEAVLDPQMLVELSKKPEPEALKGAVSMLMDLAKEAAQGGARRGALAYSPTSERESQQSQPGRISPRPEARSSALPSPRFEEPVPLPESPPSRPASQIFYRPTSVFESDENGFSIFQPVSFNERSVFDADLTGDMTVTEEGMRDIGAATAVATELESRGYSPAAIAGILGNIEVETGGTFDPRQKQIGGGNGYGLFQFDFMRPFYETWLEESGLEEGVAAQIEFMDQVVAGKPMKRTPKSEPKPILGAGDRRELIEAFNTDDPEIIARAFMAIFERPGKPHTDRRLAAARQFKELLLA